MRKLLEKYFRNFFTALADASEMAEVFRRNDVERDEENAQALKIVNGEINFNNISFTYHEPGTNRPQLFENFSLNIKAGEKVALVGQSGSGKSSLTKLLFRFLDPQHGTISFDGADAKAYTLVNLPFKGGLSRDGYYLSTAYKYAYLMRLK